MDYLDEIGQLRVLLLEFKYLDVISQIQKMALFGKKSKASRAVKLDGSTNLNVSGGSLIAAKGRIRPFHPRSLSDHHDKKVQLTQLSLCPAIATGYRRAIPTSVGFK